MYTVIELVYEDIFPNVFTDEDLEIAAEFVSKYDGTSCEFVIATIIEEE